MPKIVEVTDVTLPELDLFARLTEAQLRNRLEPEKGIFIAESPKVIERALDAGYEPVSLLMERRQLEGPARDILARCGDVPLYTAGRDTLAALCESRSGIAGLARPRKQEMFACFNRYRSLSIAAPRAQRNDKTQEKDSEL